MQAKIKFGNKIYTIDLSRPLDISIPLCAGMNTVNAFYAPPVQIEAVRAGSFVGDVREGGVVNFKNVQLNPHGNGTHTECVGHISDTGVTINQCLQQFFFLAKLISIYPQKMENGDRIITKKQVAEALGEDKVQAILIRTLPNNDDKLRINYSGSNPAYLHHEAAQYIVNQRIEHLLIDLPSVDREQDGGKLLAHRAFWQYPNQTRWHASITELIYVPNAIKDSLYFVNIMTTSLELDASPSKIVLYKLMDE